MHTTQAGEHGERVPLRPASGRLAPFGGPAEIAERFAGADEAAVHLARRVRPQPAFDREQHRLVERGQALGRVARVDEHPAEGLQRLGFEIGRPQAPAELDDLACGRALASRSPPPWAVSASRSRSAPYSIDSGSSSSASAARAAASRRRSRAGP